MQQRAFIEQTDVTVQKLGDDLIKANKKAQNYKVKRKRSIFAGIGATMIVGILGFFVY